MDLIAKNCEYLFCDCSATAQLTVPRHKPHTFLCEKHLEAQIEWAAPFRAVPGRVIIEKLK